MMVPCIHPRKSEGNEVPPVETSEKPAAFWGFTGSFRFFR